MLRPIGSATPATLAHTANVAHVDAPAQTRLDPYAIPGSYRAPTHCPECGAVYLFGRWTWTLAPRGSATQVCPACRRIADDEPAGTLSIDGTFAEDHRAELLEFIAVMAEQQRIAFPIQRVVSVEASAHRIDVSTTDIELPQYLGEALRAAYEGRLDVRYGAADYSVRVSWHR
ncbi:MAG TPA: BCAM0308 family protein [Casimicrobiaceae bacterium]|nr:BCAM0308 family protein [Casimicrobiaceae bacterium]